MVQQLDFFREITGPSTCLAGLRVQFWGECRTCGANLATLGSSSGPHFASIVCTGCGSFLAWLSADSANFINGVIDRHGRPITPIVIAPKRNF